MGARLDEWEPNSGEASVPETEVASFDASLSGAAESDLSEAKVERQRTPDTVEDGMCITDDETVISVNRWFCSSFAFHSRIQ